MYLVALNCGSSSIKGKLYAVGPKFTTVAVISVSNIGAAGDDVQLKITWEDGKNGIDEDIGKGSEVERGCRRDGADGRPRRVPKAAGEGVGAGARPTGHQVHHAQDVGVSPEIQLTQCAWRGEYQGVGGDERAQRGARGDGRAERVCAAACGCVLTVLIQNHHAVLCVKACLESLPSATNLLLFDTLFHQTLPPEVYTYALPPAPEEPVIPLRKYGFHGLSYASIVHSLAKAVGKQDAEVNIVVAHLGSGASACCIERGKSIDTSMGLTPLEGLVGGTRTGTIDPTAIVHHTKDYYKDAGVAGIKVSKGEYIMNKKSGLVAMAGTQNFGLIAKDAADDKSDNHEKAKLAYTVFLDRLMAHLSQYLFKLIERVGRENVDGIVFSGGIGENADGLRKEVMGKLAWLGVKPRTGDVGKATVETISADDSSIPVFVVRTDEEGWCAHLAREQLGI